MPTRGDTETRAGRRLGYLLKHAARLISERNDAALAPLRIDGRELGVLIVIDSHEPASQQQVAQRIGVDRTTMVAMLDALETKGLVSRRPDPEDRRRNVVALTAAGQDVLHRGTAASDMAETELLAPLSEAEGELVRELLERIVAGARFPDGAM